MIGTIALAALGSALFAEQGDRAAAVKKELAKRALFGSPWILHYACSDTSPWSIPVLATTLDDALKKLRHEIQEDGNDPGHEGWHFFAAVRGGRRLQYNEIRHYEIDNRYKAHKGCPAAVLTEPIRYLFVHEYGEPFVVEFDPSDTGSAFFLEHSPWPSAPSRTRVRVRWGNDSWPMLQDRATQAAVNRWKLGNEARRFTMERIKQGELVVGGTLVYLGAPGERLRRALL